MTVTSINLIISLVNRERLKEAFLVYALLVVALLVVALLVLADLLGRC